MKQNITLVYGLIDPIDNSFFYVGRTSTTLKRRLRDHIKDARTAPNLKAQRIRQLIQLGRSPKIVELAQLIDPSLEEAETAEQAWIDFLGLSHTLTNSKPAAAGGIGNGEGIRYVWTAEIVARLGKESDTAIAKEIGCSQTAVADQRIKLRIPKFTEHKWSPDVIARLGKESDAKIARSIGTTQSVVREKRVDLGIPAYKAIVWTTEIIEKLGTLPDSAIAEDLGCHTSVVSWQRKKLGIKPCGRPIKKVKRVAPVWNKTELPAWVIEKLGSMTDASLSMLSGFTHRVIHSARIRLGISSYSESTGHPTRFKKKTRGIESDSNSPIKK